MKYALATIGFALTLASASYSHAYSLSFSDKDYLGGASWGTIDITVQNSNTLKITYTAGLSTLIGEAEATGFGFAFTPSSTNPTSISNTNYGTNPLNWKILSNLNAIPNPANADEFLPQIITKDSFFFGATEGNVNNINPPGIEAGDSDSFDLIFTGFTGLNFNATSFKLEDFVDLVGVRLQSLPNNINGGSLFLIGKEVENGGGGGDPVVPEPGTLLLLGAGLAVLGGWKKFRK